MRVALLIASASLHGGIAMPHIAYLAILPEIVMLGGAILLLAVASLVRSALNVTVITVSTLVISLASLAAALWQFFDVQSHGAYTTLDHAVVLDGFSVLVTVLVASAMALTALVGDGYQRREGLAGPEFNVLAMVSATGAMLMGEANDLVIVFLGLEILSIALYVLAAFNRRRAESGEAALKYFLLGGFSSAIFVYGIALTYGATGTTNLTQIADFLAKNVVVSDGLLLAGLTLLLVGFAFKVAAVPFHMWTPDVYQGSPTPITGFMSAVAKAAGFAALIRVFVSSFGVQRADWQPIIYALAVVTLLVGAVLALIQTDIKRMLAYSSINHAGFVLLGLEAAGALGKVGARGVSSALYYLFAYTFMAIGSFAIVSVLGGRGDAAHEISNYKGLGKRQPFLALAFAVLLLSQAGAPFTTGFWAKLQVVAAAVDANSVPLAVIAMVSAAVAAFFYLRVVLLMYSPKKFVSDQEGDRLENLDASGDAVASTSAREPLWSGSGRQTALVNELNATLLLESSPETIEVPDEREGDVVNVPVLAVVAIGICIAVTVGFGVFPAPLADFAHKASLLFMP